MKRRTYRVMNDRTGEVFTVKRKNAWRVRDQFPRDKYTVSGPIKVKAVVKIHRPREKKRMPAFTQLSLFL